MQHDLDVFVNCPFDAKYGQLFWAIVFAIHDCGFVARCALEVDDAAETRIEKLYTIIGQAPFGIHDISRTQLDAKTRLPRFNMPLELGLFLGGRRYDRKQRRKRCLVLDTKPYRYQAFISDIAGQDIRAHGGSVARVISIIRDWLRQWLTDPGVSVPGGKAMLARYRRFLLELPVMCKAEQLDLAALPYVDHHKLIVGWLQQNP